MWVPIVIDLESAKCFEVLVKKILGALAFEFGSVCNARGSGKKVAGSKILCISKERLQSFYSAGCVKAEFYGFSRKRTESRL